MRSRTLEKTLPDECFTQEQLNILFCPALGGKTLKKHHNLLKIHVEELIGPLHKKGRTHVQMEFGEALLFGLVNWLAFRNLWQ